MSKFYGKIGYIKTTESKPGIWSENEITKDSYGDIINSSNKYTTDNSSTNDNIDISMVLSIILDEYIINNLRYIKFVEYMGVKWKVTKFEIKHPRILLTLGGIYNG